MKRLHLAYALTCLLGACAPAVAQTAAGVADPQAAVPATTYQPALRHDAPAAPAASPDQTWRAANATVGGRNPMRLTMPAMGGMQDMSGHDMSGHAMHDTAPDTAAAGPQCKPGSGMQCMAGAGCCDKGCCDKGCCDKGCCDKAGGSKGCCGGNEQAGNHAHHAGMTMEHGCCDHKEAK